MQREDNKEGAPKRIKGEERRQLAALRPELLALREIPQRTHTMPPMSMSDSPGVRGRRRQRHCRHLDMHYMSTTARASGALGRENVRPRNVDRKVDMFQPTTRRPSRGAAARPTQAY